MDIFTTALGLSKQGNGFELTGFLVAQINQQFEAEDVAVFEVFGIPGNYTGEHAVDLDNMSIRRFDHDAGNKRFHTDTTPFVEIIKSNRQIGTPIENRDTGQIIIPIPSRNGPLRMISITGLEESPEKRLRLFQVIEFYASMIDLHDSHERDQLTGLHNRQTFNDFYERTVRSISAEGSTMYLAVLDIDHFKRVNDTYGHLFGDEVLLQFANLMEKNFRYSDALFRFGGEEFIALLKCDNGKCADIALNRFRTSVESHDFPGVGNITVSIGFSQCDPGQFANNVIGMADNALYYAKEHGRNQVVDYEQVRQPEKTAEGDIDLF